MTQLGTDRAATRDLPLAPGGSVEIVLAACNLRIRGTDGDRVVVRSRDGAPLDDDIVFEAAPNAVRIRDGDGGLRLGPVRIRTRRSPDLDIDLPRAAAVSLRTMSGDVEATGIGGASRWASASGDLRLAVSAGPVRLESMSGDAVLEASAAIALTARTVSGDLVATAPLLESLDASTTSGDVRVDADLAAGASHAISSVSGDVDVITASPVRLEAQTIAGDVRASGLHVTEGGRGRRTLVVGSGAVVLTVRTTSGDVRLRSRGGQGVVAPRRPVPPVAPGPPVPPVAPRPAAAPRPLADEETQAWNAPEPAVDRREAERLNVLRALERGDLDVDTATRRLEALEEAGPTAFRGWC